MREHEKTTVPALSCSDSNFGGLKICIDGNDLRNACYFQYFCNILLRVEQSHFPTLVGNRFGCIDQHGDPDRGEVIYSGEIHNDLNILSRTLTDKFNFDTIGPVHIQCADKFDQADAVVQLSILKFHSYYAVS